MVFQSLQLNIITERNLQGIAKQTKKLDPQTRHHLQDYLHSHIFQNQDEELEHLEQELHQASIQLTQLQEKEEFVGTRLRAYKTKLQAIPTDEEEYHDDDTTEEEKEKEDSNSESSPTTTDASRSAKQEHHQESLETIQQVHDAVLHNIDALKKKMIGMEKRKLEVSRYLQECQVVLKTAQELDQMETETELAADEKHVMPTKDVDDNDNSGGAGVIPVKTETSAKQEQSRDDSDHDDDNDEEAGKTDEVDEQRIRRNEDYTHVEEGKLAIADKERGAFQVCSYS